MTPLLPLLPSAVVMTMVNDEDESSRSALSSSFGLNRHRIFNLINLTLLNTMESELPWRGYRMSTAGLPGIKLQHIHGKGNTKLLFLLGILVVPSLDLSMLCL